MSLPAAFPVGLDSLANPTATTNRNDPGFELDLVVARIHDILEALEAKAGIGASLPALGQVYRGTGSGSSAWGALQIADIGGAALDALLAPGGLLLNGNFDVWQRGTALRTITPAYDALNGMGPDRWAIVPAGGNVSVQVNAGGYDTKSRNGWWIQGNAGVTTVAIFQRIEAALVQTLGRQPLIFSIATQNNTGGSFTPTLAVFTPSAADNWGTSAQVATPTLGAVAASGWTRVTASFDPSGYSNVANGMSLVLTIPSGSLNTSGKTIVLSQADLRPGSSFGSYVPPDPLLTDIVCRRYYEPVGGVAAGPIDSAGVANGTTSGFVQVNWSPKRIAPSLTLPAASSLYVRLAASTPLLSSVSAAGAISPVGCELAVGFASGAAAGQAMVLYANSASGIIHALAEL